METPPKPKGKTTISKKKLREIREARLSLSDKQISVMGVQWSEGMDDGDFNNWFDED